MKSKQPEKRNGKTVLERTPLPKVTNANREVHEIVTKQFDPAIRATNFKWGTDRLPELVGPVKEARWLEVVDELNEAIAANDPQRVQGAVSTALKGLAVMDAAAEQDGAEKRAPELLVGEAEGFAFGIMPDDRFAEQYENENEGLLLFTLHQVGVILKDRVENSPALQAARKHFPDAEVKAVRPRSKLEQELGDSIPF